MRAAHGTICLEVVCGIIVRIEVFKFDIPTGMHDIVRGRSIGPLRHARCTQQVIAARSHRRKEQKLADLTVISSVLSEKSQKSLQGRGHRERQSRKTRFLRA